MCCKALDVSYGRDEAAAAGQQWGSPKCTMACTPGRLILDIVAECLVKRVHAHVFGCPHARRGCLGQMA